ncbi:hypothetical protein RUM43_010463 [Polyplax serrata]|uniref:SCAF8 n=1 Tax=Polyplax serrata TaxID=468196 RepID=A0AAN8P9J6_POLSC
MDAVKAFNNELSALYEVKPPITKAKMSSITRSAIKAIKFYKHVVQSVEKFIQKCKPEYKVPGLYVIDSIVRQSRHQFGPDKDLFAPRFAKNMQNTFANLFSCPPEDKGKIIRVLNLWQKNSVFTPDVIQPLFDQLADPNNPIHRENLAASNGLNTSLDLTSPSSISKSSGLMGKTGLNIPTDTSTPHWVKMAQSQIDAANKAIYELTGTSLQQSKTSSNSSLDILQQIQQLQQFILSQTTQANQKVERSQSDQVVFDKKLLDFDYDDDDEENTSPHQQSNNNDNFNNILQNPEILRQLTALQQQMSQHQLRQQQLEVEEKMRKLKEMKQQEEEFDKHLAQTVPKLPFASECDLKQYQEPVVSNTMPDLSVPPPGYPKQSHRMDPHDSEVECIDDESNERFLSEWTKNYDSVIRYFYKSVILVEFVYVSVEPTLEKKSEGGIETSRSLTCLIGAPPVHHHIAAVVEGTVVPGLGIVGEAEDPVRGRRDLVPAHSDQREDTDLVQSQGIVLCSTTLWVGHLSKLVQQEELSDTFGEFGDIVSIDVIPPRGCAFICMNRRQDAARALTRLKDHKLHGKNIMLAWAPGKGVKGRDYKDYWEIDLGVSYIPWNRLSKKTDFMTLEEGGSLDEDTMPESLKEYILDQLRRRKDEIGAENKLGLAAAGYTTLPDGIPAPPVPPVLAAALPTVMTVPPPVLGASNSPATPAIDTSQPPPNMSPSSKGVSVLSNPSIGLPQITPRIPVMGKPGLMMPPFSFTSLPPPLSLGMPNMMGNLPIGVPPPSMQGLLMQQQMMAGIPTTGASPFPPGTILPSMTVPAGASDKLGGLALASGELGFDRHPLQGQPLGIANHKDDDGMDLDEEGDDEKSKAKVRSPHGKSGDASRGDGRRDEDRRDDRGRDRDRDRDKDRRDRDRGRDRERDRDCRDRDRDYRDRDRDKRRNRSRDRDDRSKGRDRDYRNRSRERDNRRDRSRTSDRDRSRDRTKEKDSENDGKREDGKKDPVNQWVEVPISSEDKPSLLQRLRNIAEGGDTSQRTDQMNQIFGGPPPDLSELGGNRPGPPIVINLNNCGVPRPGLPPFGPRGPLLDSFRPEFGLQGPRGPLDFGGRGNFPPDGLSSDDGFDPRGRGPMGPEQNDRNRGRFDHTGPRPLMEAHFDGPPIISDDLRGPMLHDGMRGPMMHPEDMMCPDDLRTGPIFMDPMDDPRIRFGPRGLMGPMPRGPMGPHGPGPVPLFGPRGPRPLLGRPNMWMDNQGPPPLGDGIIRPSFDDRPGGPRRNSGPRFRGDRPRDRESRWSKEESKDSTPRLETNKKPAVEEDEVRTETEVQEPVRDTQTPCHDEKPIAETDNEAAPQEVANATADELRPVPEEFEPPPIEQSQPPLEYERDTATPCHDEPEIPNIVVENSEAMNKEV